MATERPLDPEFQAVVDRARKLARERGEILDGPGTPPDRYEDVAMVLWELWDSNDWISK